MRIGTGHVWNENLENTEKKHEKSYKAKNMSSKRKVNTEKTYLDEQ